MAKFLKSLAGVARTAAPYAGAAIGGALGGPAGAAAGYKAGKAVGGAIPGGDSKKSGFSIPPTINNFADAGGENSKHAKSKYGFPGD